MGGLRRLRPPHAPSGAHTGSAKAKVKTGCGTCRTRKVKCDEARPACARCVSTGRVCEGYGIWGGGSSFDPICKGPPKQIISGVVTLKSQDEFGLLEWFRCRTSVKMQGAFGSPFWDTVVIRASLEEPSILHAALALSSAHKRVCIHADGAGWGANLDTGLSERFTLRQSSIAINHLKPRLMTQGVTSVRIALVACMIFTCLEFLCGHYSTGLRHLESGMRLLAELQGELGRRDGSSEGTDMSVNRDPIDSSLIQAFTRMNLAARQLGRGPRVPIDSQFPTHQCLPITFDSLGQARYTLDCLLRGILQLGARCLQEGATGGSANSTPDPGLFDLQQRIKSNLAEWENTYKASRVNFQAQTGAVSRIGYRLLSVYHIMANILVDTCLRPNDEMAFDSHHQDFACLIAHSVRFLEAVRAVHDLNHPAFRAGSEGSLFTPDIGWTPPLYYTALHCRVRPTRLHAIALLRLLPSREGIWDSLFAASVAQEIMRIEEGDMYQDTPVGNPISVPDQLQNNDPSLPTLPASRRVYDVEVSLPDSSSSRAVLTCKRNRVGGGFELITSQCDVRPRENAANDM